MFEVVVVDASQLPAPWASARSDDGGEVLFLNETASLVQAIEGYSVAHRQHAGRY
jgi:hypothetical protein